MKNYEIVCFKVIYDDKYDGEEITETFDTELEAVNRANYLLLLCKEFYTNIRVHEVRNVDW